MNKRANTLTPMAKSQGTSRPPRSGNHGQVRHSNSLGVPSGKTEASQLQPASRKASQFHNPIVTEPRSIKEKPTHVGMKTPPIRLPLLCVGSLTVVKLKTNNADTSCFPAIQHGVGNGNKPKGPLKAFQPFTSVNQTHKENMGNTKAAMVPKRLLLTLGTLSPDGGQIVARTVPCPVGTALQSQHNLMSLHKASVDKPPTTQTKRQMLGEIPDAPLAPSSSPVDVMQVDPEPCIQSTKPCSRSERVANAANSGSQSCPQLAQVHLGNSAAMAELLTKIQGGVSGDYYGKPAVTLARSSGRKGLCLGRKPSRPVLEPPARHVPAPLCTLMPEAKAIGVKALGGSKAPDARKPSALMPTRPLVCIPVPVKPTTLSVSLRILMTRVSPAVTGSPVLTKRDSDLPGLQVSSDCLAAMSPTLTACLGPSAPADVVPGKLAPLVTAKPLSRKAQVSVSPTATAALAPAAPTAPVPMTPASQDKPLLLVFSPGAATPALHVTTIPVSPVFISPDIVLQGSPVRPATPLPYGRLATDVPVMPDTPFMQRLLSPRGPSASPPASPEPAPPASPVPAPPASANTNTPERRRQRRVTQRNCRSLIQNLQSLQLMGLVEQPAIMPPDPLPLFSQEQVFLCRPPIACVPSIVGGDHGHQPPLERPRQGPDPAPAVLLPMRRAVQEPPPEDIVLPPLTGPHEVDRFNMPSSRAKAERQWENSRRRSYRPACLEGFGFLFKTGPFLPVCHKPTLSPIQELREQEEDEEMLLYWKSLETTTKLESEAKRPTISLDNPASARFVPKTRAPIHAHRIMMFP